MGCLNSKVVFPQRPVDTIRYSSTLSFERKSQIPSKLDAHVMVDVIWIAHDFITTECQNTRTSSSTKEQAVREQCTMIASDVSKLSFWLERVAALPKTTENREEIIDLLRSYLDVAGSVATVGEEGSAVS